VKGSRRDRAPAGMWRSLYAACEYFCRICLRVRVFCGYCSRHAFIAGPSIFAQIGERSIDVIERSISHGGAFSYASSTPEPDFIFA
jgi:hypothetical protein